jgi:lsr operon transcriptional repressor
LAAYARRFLHPGAVVGVSWGDSVARALSMLSEEALDGVQLVAATGGLSSLDEVLTRAPGVLRRLRTVPAPMLVSSPEVAETFRAEAAVGEVLDLARGAVVTLTGMGAAVPGGSAVRAGVTTDEEVAEFAARGAVGDTMGEWFDIEGRAVTTRWTTQRVGLTLDELRVMSNVVGVAGGAEKADAIRGAVVGGLIDVLVTDEPAAQALLDRWADDGGRNR